MSRRPSKVQRLVRLNKFREDLAGGVLRQAISDQLNARENHQSASNAVDQLGAWKARSSTASGLDLGFYGAVLEMEQSAMARADQLRLEMLDCEKRADQAQDALIDAASATRAAENRGQREQTLAKTTQEKRTYDQVSDLLLGNREKKND